ncbi:hypothetical protein B6U80_01820 [Candidatus Pacearchaeota archaeon ex4484_26]|nr:MAG: hypothetical protein B6U80_01820 [Candidatus Pacearchaeota archaeon ex4484_26]
MNKKAEWRGWLIFINVLVVGWLIINNVYIVYKTEKINTPNVYCENNVVKQEYGGLIGSLSGTLVSLYCMDYLNSKYSLSCNENDEVIITCKTTIYSRFFSAGKEFDWLIN